MLVTLKTLQEDIFTVKIDPSQTVKYFKEKIERVKGNEFSAKNMKLMYAGTLLVDNKKVSDYNVEEKKFVIVVDKKGITQMDRSIVHTISQNLGISSEDEISEASTSYTRKFQFTIPEFQITIPEYQFKPKATIVKEPEPESISEMTQDRSNFMNGPRNADEALVRHITELGFTRAEVEAALTASFNNPDRAVEYLINGALPSSSNEDAETEARRRNSYNISEWDDEYKEPPPPPPLSLEYVSSDVKDYFLDSLNQSYKNKDAYETKAAAGKPFLASNGTLPSSRTLSANADNIFSRQEFFPREHRNESDNGKLSAFLHNITASQITLLQQAHSSRETNRNFPSNIHNISSLKASFLPQENRNGCTNSNSKEMSIKIATNGNNIGEYERTSNAVSVSKQIEYSKVPIIQVKQNNCSKTNNNDCAKIRSVLEQLKIFKQQLKNDPSSPRKKIIRNGNKSNKIYTEVLSSETKLHKPNCLQSALLLIEAAMEQFQMAKNINEETFNIAIAAIRDLKKRNRKLEEELQRQKSKEAYLTEKQMQEDYAEALSSIQNSRNPEDLLKIIDATIKKLRNHEEKIRSSHIHYF